jgi:prohibitin 1
MWLINWQCCFISLFSLWYLLLNTIFMRLPYILCVVSALITSCTVVQPGNVGVKRRLGVQNPVIREPGMYTYNPFTTHIIVVPIRTENLEIRADLPSKEGLTIQSDISILYHLDKKMVPVILEEVGKDYENQVVLSVFRSAAADVCAQFMAKDMHSGERSVIEEKIKLRMDELLRARGFIIESVLMKTIRLPEGLSRSIEMRLQAEQDAERMKFLLQRERLEAERRRIEAEGTRDAQKILSEGLSEAIIKLRSIEAFKELANSPNTKIIITDGKAPYLIGN